MAICPPYWERLHPFFWVGFLLALIAIFHTRSGAGFVFVIHEPQIIRKKPLLFQLSSYFVRQTWKKRKTNKRKTPLSCCPFCSFLGFLILYETVTFSQKRQSYILMLENRWECYVPTLPLTAMFCDRCEEGHSDREWEYQKNLIHASVTFLILKQLIDQHRVLLVVRPWFQVFSLLLLFIFLVFRYTDCSCSNTLKSPSLITRIMS